MTRTEQATYQQGIDARNANESIDSYPGYLTPAMRSWWKAGWLDRDIEIGRRSYA